MNIKLLYITIAASLTIPAFADSLGTADFPAGTKTRAEVRTELKAAQERGELAFSDADYPRLHTATSSKTRSEVRAEVIEARAQGQLAFSDASYPALPESDASKSRADVRAELKEAIAQGLLPISDSDYPRHQIR